MEVDLTAAAMRAQHLVDLGAPQRATEARSHTIHRMFTGSAGIACMTTCSTSEFQLPQVR
jgi:hypothetical protein